MDYEFALREANRVRHIEWSNGGEDGAEFYAIELYGEVGELLNVVKKLERERLGMVGSRATLTDLADELADVVICIDLLLLAYRRPPVAASLVMPGSPLKAAIALGRNIGCAMDMVLELGDYDVEAPQWPFDELEASLSYSLGFAAALASAHQIDLRSAVISKFNKTSTKYGLRTMLDADASLM